MKMSTEKENSALYYVEVMNLAYSELSVADYTLLLGDLQPDSSSQACY